MVLQRTESNISEIIPSLIFLFDTWEIMAQKEGFKQICQALIKFFMHKFKYELESSQYSVASLLNTSKLELWFSDPKAIEYHDRSLGSLTSVITELHKKDKIDKDQVNRTSEIRVNISNENTKKQDFFSKIYSTSSRVTNSQISTDISVETKIESEIKKFKQILLNNPDDLLHNN